MWVVSSRQERSLQVLGGLLLLRVVADPKTGGWRAFLCGARRSNRRCPLAFATAEEAMAGAERWAKAVLAEAGA